jgi:ABC-2 type transport system permease protein
LYKKLYGRYRYSAILLKQLVVTDFKLRYQNSFLGYLWSLLRPLSLFLILYVVFVMFFHVDYGVKGSAVYLLLGIVIWNYFGEVTNIGATSIVSRGDLLRKINFPKYVIVLAGSFTALINLLINLFVVFCFSLISHVHLGLTLLFLPSLLVELFLIALSIAFILAALFVKLRDINYIWEVIMQAAFYGTPIVYSLKQPFFLHHPLTQKLLLLNPVAQMVQDARAAVFGGKIPTIATAYGNAWFRLIPIGMVLLISLFAAQFFRKRSKYFAEEI